MIDTQERARPVHPWVMEGQRNIRFSVTLWPDPAWRTLVDTVQQAEALGFDAYMTYDHPSGGSPDCWTALAALAARTTRIRLGPEVNCVYYRNPVMLARLAADIDRISDGRLILGLGIGWAEQEFTELGTPFPPVRERQRALEDTVKILHGVWGDAPFTYEGSQFSVHEVRITDGPVQQPYVPIMIAGGGEQVTLHQVARYADMSMFGPQGGEAKTLADVCRKLEVLRQYCDALGRPYTSVVRKYGSGGVVIGASSAVVERTLERLFPGDALAAVRDRLVVGTPEEVTAHFQALVDVGMQYFSAVVIVGDDDTLPLLAERVLPNLSYREISPQVSLV